MNLRNGEHMTRLCSNCHIHQRLPRSNYCSAVCREQYRAEHKRDRHGSNGTRGRPAQPPSCPVCGEMISVVKDCRCPQN